MLIQLYRHEDANIFRFLMAESTSELPIHD
jgi:hypothetical protein